MIVTISLSAQEICDNGIDDDGDTLIDLNDDECVCAEERPLTMERGNPCQTLVLEFEVPGGVSYQWYKDGIAIDRYTEKDMSVTRWNPTGNGIYTCVVTLADGTCVNSVPYNALRDEYFIDLGVVFICEGDSLDVNGYMFFKQGVQQAKNKTSEGCDSIVYFEIKFVDPASKKQSWFSDEDRWVYRYFAPFSTTGYGEMQVVGDTLINNQSAKVLVIDRETVEQSSGWENSSTDRIIAYEENNRVYVLNQLNEFALTYDFNLEIGDSLVYYGFQGLGELCQDSIVYFLDSLSTLELASGPLIAQHFNFIDYHWDYEGQRTVIEKIGFMEGGMDLSDHHVCYFDAPGYTLCSYENGQSYEKFLDRDCYELPVSTEDVVEGSAFVYPNPFTDDLYISNFQLIKTISVFGIDGSLISNHKSKEVIDLSDLQMGTYLLSKNYKSGQQESTVIIKI